MQVINDIVSVRARLNIWRQQGARLAFVPTMGNLHEGHLSLVEQAHHHGDKVVVSIFVNPMQFGKGEDLSAYPRTMTEDRHILGRAGVDILFIPSEDEIYPGGVELATQIEVPGLSDILCGASRPGHFTGVATVVCKLFNVIQPDVALFGEKDYQQLLVIQRMVRDLCLPVEVIGIPTVREASGLALSSRNGYLTPQERETAAWLYRCLCDTRERILACETDYAAIGTQMSNKLREQGLLPEYFEVRRVSDLLPAMPQDDKLIVLVAAQLGRARLIDNLKINRGGESPS
jgi:pantoate--beta-alanine ligase